MIEPPSITLRPGSHAAVVPLVISRDAMPRYFGAAITEIMAVLTAQGIEPAGPVVAHHLRPTPTMFDFEVAVPVGRPVTAAGRVEPRDWPPRTVAATVYRGPYDGLHGAWGLFMAWLAANGHRPAPDLYETYLTDPNVVSDPAEYRTRLERPLA